MSDGIDDYIRVRRLIERLTWISRMNIAWEQRQTGADNQQEGEPSVELHQRVGEEPGLPPPA